MTDKGITAAFFLTWGMLWLLLAKLSQNTASIVLAYVLAAGFTIAALCVSYRDKP